MRKYVYPSINFNVPAEMRKQIDELVLQPTNVIIREFGRNPSMAEIGRLALQIGLNTLAQQGEIRA